MNGFNRFLNFETKTITFAAILLTASALGSRILGLFRDRLLAGKFGAGQELDIYWAAFRIPDFIYGILIMGGIVATFLPIFSEYFEKDKKEAWKMTSNVLNCFFILLVFICGILAIFTPQILNLITPGFSLEQKALTVQLTRIMFLSPILFGLSSIFSGILQYFNRFLVFSLAPILYNLGIIFGIIFFVPLFGLSGLAYGVILGAVLYWFIQIPSALSAGFKYQITFDFKHPGLLRIFKLMTPRIIGASAYHLNLIVITAIASTLAVGSISIFNFSNNLYYFPVGLIGVSFALASFPKLTQAWAEGKKEKFLDYFSSTFRQILFLIIPISFLMFLLRAQLVRVVLGTGEFGWLETRLTAASLGIFSISILAFSLIPFLARTFFSLQDTRTPVKIGILSMVLNVILSFLFVWLLGFSNIFQDFMINFLKLQGIKNIEVVGLPLALSISGIFQSFLLLLFLRKKIKHLPLKEFWSSLKKIIIATFLMILSVYLTLYLVAVAIGLQTFLGVLFQLSAAVIIGGFVYLLTVYFLKSPELKIVKSSILRQFKKDQ